MKHQQVVIDYWEMVRYSFTYLLLAFCGYILIKMIQTVFWLPGYLQNNQKRLEELAEKYSVDLKNINDGTRATDFIEETPKKVKKEQKKSQVVEDKKGK